ncbi:HAD-like domain-containing protein [Phycomyces nitens]|nr:HAD-like domain-containing protein [Phycomyces nitens]
MKLIQSLSELPVEYDIFAIDIFGVLHDGIQSYSYAKQALEALSHNGNKTVLLSNSTRLGNVLCIDLERKFDIQPQSYGSILSSGQITKLFLTDCAKYLKSAQSNQPESCIATLVKGTNPATRLGPIEFTQRYLNTGKFCLIGLPAWQEPIYGPLYPTIEQTDDWDAMEFVLLGKVSPLKGQDDVDCFDEQNIRQHYEPFLQKCLTRSIPILCANPDIWAPNGFHEDGSHRLIGCPGYIAEMYKTIGGEVLYFGKPYESIYRFLLENIKPKTSEPGRVLCIGDNVATDVLGAREAGLDVVMILGGIHAQEMLEIKGDEVIKKEYVLGGPIWKGVLGINLYFSVLSFQYRSPLFSYLNHTALLVQAIICLVFAFASLIGLFSLFVNKPAVLRQSHRFIWMINMVFIIDLFVNIILFGVQWPQFSSWCVSRSREILDDTITVDYSNGDNFTATYLPNVVGSDLYNCNKLWQDELKFGISIYVMIVICYIYWALCLWSYTQKQMIVLHYELQAHAAAAAGIPEQMMNLKPGDNGMPVTIEDDGQRSLAQITRAFFNSIGTKGRSRDDQSETTAV